MLRHAGCARTPAKSAVGRREEKKGIIYHNVNVNVNRYRLRFLDKQWWLGEVENRSPGSSSASLPAA